MPHLFRLPLALGILILVGCAGHGTHPSMVEGHPPAVASREEAKIAYVAGDMPHAAALYQALVDAQPDDAELWYRLGNARFRQQQTDKAVAAYERAIQLRPDYARALYNLGVVRLKQAQSAMLASAQAGKPGDPLRRDSGRIAQRLAKVGDDMPMHARGDGGAPPFIVDAEDAP